MVRLRKCGVLAILCFTAMALGACGKRTEAVITDGEDITDASTEYPTLEERFENRKHNISYDRGSGKIYIGKAI